MPALSRIPAAEGIHAMQRIIYSIIAELACLVVHPDYRTSGRGDQLLHYLERECAAQGLGSLFVLTTQTSHWFRERGFDACVLKGGLNQLAGDRPRPPAEKDDPPLTLQED